MLLLTSQYFSLTLITVFFYMQYHISISVSVTFSFFCFYFNFFFLSSSPRGTFYNLSRMLITYDLIRTRIRLFKNKKYKKYLPNCHQLFKTRKKMMRKNCYDLFKKHFSILIFYHILMLQVYYQQALPARQLVFIGIFQNVFRS